MDIEYIAILIPFAGMALGGWIAYIAITASHRENMAMIEAGMNPKKEEEKKKVRNNVRNAMLLICVPIGVLVGRLMAEPFNLEPQHGAVVFAFLFGGIALISAHYLKENKEDNENKGNQDSAAQ
jgi:uncharacterized membrane protein